MGPMDRNIHSKLRELRENLNKAILIQASQEEGATTIPKGSRIK